MPKKRKDYPDQVNVLTYKDTLVNLKAIAYFTGNNGEYATPARKFIAQGIQEFIEGLSEKDKRRFNEILENVRITRGGEFPQS